MRLLFFVDQRVFRNLFWKISKPAEETQPPPAAFKLVTARVFRGLARLRDEIPSTGKFNFSHRDGGLRCVAGNDGAKKKRILSSFFDGVFNGARQTKTETRAGHTFFFFLPRLFARYRAEATRSHQVSRRGGVSFNYFLFQRAEPTMWPHQEEEAVKEERDNNTRRQRRLRGEGEKNCNNNNNIAGLSLTQSVSKRRQRQPSHRRP